MTNEEASDVQSKKAAKKLAAKAEKAAKVKFTRIFQYCKNDKKNVYFLES